MTNFTGIALFVIGFISGAIVIWLVRQRELKSVAASQKQLEDAFGSLSREALDANQKTFLELARSQFDNLLKSSDNQLDEKKKLIDGTINDMKTQLENLNRQTSALKGSLEESQQGISRLTDTTGQLRQILSSSQARGQWGERMVEDILNFIGLVEGINYSKQSMEGSNRPDYTFILPHDKRINMDVKFPLVHYERYLTAEQDDQRENAKKQFLNDVRGHIKAIAKRDYIDPAGGTVNYVLLFIPNESIYSFLNQADTELIDFSLSQRIILCSPITLYAVLSLIRQAVDSFAMEARAGEMQKLVQEFKQQWGKFNEKIDSLGKSLTATRNHFEDLATTRTNKLQKPMDKIADLQLAPGSEPELLEE
ncbi:MAG: DNA recombination protein RmuC [Candidatus Neomarinimicrobiota bacterium]